MKRIFFYVFLAILMSMVGTKAFAYDIAVENSDGVTIYYNYINNSTELEVTNSNSSDDYYGYWGKYSGNVVIPSEVTYMNRTRKVTRIRQYAFINSKNLTSVTIPNSVGGIGAAAFYYCTSLTSVTIPNSVTSIGSEAFYDCSSLTSVTIPDSVTRIWGKTFIYCTSLTSVTIPNSVKDIGESAFSYCTSLTSVTIPNSVTSIQKRAFYNCSSLTSVTIPNSVDNIGEYAFYNCSSLTSVTIPNSLTSIQGHVFEKCSSLTSVTIPNSVTSIGTDAFKEDGIITVFSEIIEPFPISTVFSQDTYYNATLYVPAGTIDKYKATPTWNEFVFIEEGNGGGETPTPQKCEKPTISYNHGKLTFNSTTDGVVFCSTITDTDINSYYSNEVQLGVTYNISVYATKEGYENSETVTATLCWIDVEPQTENISNGIANVNAMAVLIQNIGGQITVNGVNDGAKVSVFNLNGTMAGSAISSNGSAVLNTNLQMGSVVIVKIGENSIKVLLK